MINDLSGTVSFEDMKKMHANETYREHLSSCGLTNDEILFKVKYESGCLTKKNVSFNAISPEIVYLILINSKNHYYRIIAQ